MVVCLIKADKRGSGVQGVGERKREREKREERREEEIFKRCRINQDF